jgi:predicted small metal-binding protein
MKRNRYWTAAALMSPRPVGRAGGGTPREINVGRPSMKEFYCGAIIPDCDTRIIAATEDDLLASVDTHARVDHGMTEVPAALIDEVRARIQDVEPPLDDELDS